MLSSVLVASHDATRRKQLATEALAIAAADGSPELLASAHLAQRLALWQLDRLDERAEVAMTAVREAGRTTNVQLQLTAKLFALADLLELGRIEDHLAMLSEFRAQAADAHLRAVRRVRDVPGGVPPRLDRPLRRGAEAGRRGPGDGSAVPRGERRGRVRRLRLPGGDGPWAAGLVAARHRTAGGDPPAAHVADLSSAHPHRSARSTCRCRATARRVRRCRPGAHRSEPDVPAGRRGARRGHPCPR